MATYKSSFLNLAYFFRTGNEDDSLLSPADHYGFLIKVYNGENIEGLHLDVAAVETLNKKILKTRVKDEHTIKNHDAGSKNWKVDLRTNQFFNIGINFPPPEKDH